MGNSQANGTNSMEFSKRLLELSARDSRDNIPLATTVLFIITLGVIGNTTALVFYGFKDRKTITNFLIAVLALNDLIQNIVFYDEMFFHFQPFKFTNTAGCKMLYVMNNWVLMNSVSLMLVIAVERYRKICHPFARQFTFLSAKVTTVCVTITTLVICSKEAIFAEIVPEHILMNDNSTVEGYVCVHSHDKKLKPFIRGSNFLTMAIYVGLFASIITLYSMIIRRIYQTNKAAASNKNTSGKHEGLEMKQSTYSSSNTTASTGDSIIHGIQAESGENANTGTSNANDQTLPITGTDAEDGQIPPENCKDTDKYIKGRKSNQSIRKSESQRLTKKEKQKKQSPNKLAEVEAKMTKMVIFIAIASILSFLPYFLVILLVPSHNSTEDRLSNMKKKAFRESYKLNGVINPYIMCIFSVNFRQFVISIFCRCCKRK